MKTVVQIFYTLGGGSAESFVRVFDGRDGVLPMGTADAVCLAIDDLEVSGVDLNAVTSFAAVAKRGIGADALLPADHGGRLGAVAERLPCGG